MKPDVENAVLRGEALRTATPEDAWRITDQYEKEDFLRFQSVGYQWSPTRKMLIDHIRRYIDEMPELRKSLRVLKLTAILEAAAIIGIIASRLTQ